MRVLDDTLEEQRVRNAPISHLPRCCIWPELLHIEPHLASLASEPHIAFLVHLMHRNVIRHLLRQRQQCAPPATHHLRNGQRLYSVEADLSPTTEKDAITSSADSTESTVPIGSTDSSSPDIVTTSPERIPDEVRKNLETLDQSTLLDVKIKLNTLDKMLTTNKTAIPALFSRGSSSVDSPEYIVAPPPRPHPRSPLQDRQRLKAHPAHEKPTYRTYRAWITKSKTMAWRSGKWR